MAESLFDEIVEKNIKHDNHESDLYIPYTHENAEMVTRWNKTYTLFKNQKEGGVWMEIAFAYLPWWDKRIR